MHTSKCALMTLKLFGHFQSYSSWQACFKGIHQYFIWLLDSQIPLFSTDSNTLYTMYIYTLVKKMKNIRFF